jgi:hypothetical protein
MSRIFTFVVILGMIASLFPMGAAASSLPSTQSALSQGDVSTEQPTGMPGFPIPAKPLPHHEPGQPARSGDATTSIAQVNAEGKAETVELKGMDALLADGTLSDPLAGNYSLLNLDKIFFTNLDTSQSVFNSTTYVIADWLPPDPVTHIPNVDRIGSVGNYGNVRFATSAAGDLNGDGVDEQIVTWIDPANKHIKLSIGDLDTVAGKTTSTPAAVANTDGSLDLFVRGYDYALWSRHSDGANWGDWTNAAGGLLVSGPAVVSRAENELDAFVIGSDNQVYHQHKGAGGWEGWNGVQSNTTLFPALKAEDFLLSVASPAVVARGNMLDLFRLRSNGTLYWSHSDDGSAWTAWQSLGDKLASAPGAVSFKKEGDAEVTDMQVYALGPDGAPWYRTYTGGAWGGWKYLPFSGKASWNAVPVLTSPGTGQVTLYLAGDEKKTDGSREYKIWKNSLNGTTWGGWSSTTLPAGSIDKGIAAADGPAGTYLFTHMSGGSLQYRLGSGDWTSLPGMAIAPTQFDTGAVTAALPTSEVLENHLIDITTGYLAGDGRKQVILTYMGADNLIHVEVYDAKDGFKLQKIAELAPGYSATWPKVAAGDVDGDFLDEIGLAAVQDLESAARKVQLWVLRPEKAEGAWTGTLSEVDSREDVIENSKGNIWDGWLFAGTLRIAAGDIVPADLNTDEFVIMANWRHDAYGSYRAVAVTLDIYDSQAATKMSRPFRQEIQAGGTSYWNTIYATGFGMAVGDVDGDKSNWGNEEVVLTYPEGFIAGHYPDVQRSIRVYGINMVMENNTPTPTWKEIKKSALIGSYSRASYLDTLAVGDINQDLRDEIILFAPTGGDNLARPIIRSIYSFASLDTAPIASSAFYPTQRQLAYNLVTGNFTGEGIKVGPPTYRRQNGMVSPQVIMNMPPVHRDIIDGYGEFDVETGAYATYTASTTSQGETSTESKRDWSLSVGVEVSVGAAGSKVETSLKNTYGENFSHSTAKINTTTLTSVSDAQYWDFLLYNQTSYDIWEYPVYGVSPQDPKEAATIAVIWPITDSLTTTNSPTHTQGQICDENFYAPSHQTNNIWSYSEIGAPIFGDYYNDGYVFAGKTDGGQTITATMANTSVDKRSKGFSNQISAGLSYSYETSFKIPLIGSAWDFSFRASTEANYGINQTSTLTDTFTNETKVEAHFPSSANQNRYEIKSFLYWAKAGYLVLDYQTEPDMRVGEWWRYNKTDPAFILPWYGFPDPVTGVFPTTGPDHPYCGLDKQLFTHDITIKPAVAENGDPVFLKATVRNFSDVLPTEDVANVKVSFYLGAPGSGNQIGFCNIPRAELNRVNGPASCYTTWTVSGASGEEKIYAVIDPDNDIREEMHQAGSKINNNTGYGLFKVASANYFDPGSSQKPAYQAIEYATEPQSAASFAGTQESTRVQYGLYVPTADLSETIRYELVSAEAGGLVRAVGVPVQVLAYSGGKKDPTAGATFTPNPAMLQVTYADKALLPGMKEGGLKLYRQKGSTWEEVTCPGSSIQRFPDYNLIVFPVCKVGTFVLNDRLPTNKSYVYLPVLKK